MCKNNEKTNFESIGGYRKRGTCTSSSTTWKIKKRDVRWSGGECALGGMLVGISEGAVRAQCDVSEMPRSGTEKLLRN